MYVCIYVSMYICIYMYICNLTVGERDHCPALLARRRTLSLSVCLAVYVYLYIYVYTYMYICVYIYIYTYICMYVYLHIYVTWQLARERMAPRSSPAAEPSPPAAVVRSRSAFRVTRVAHAKAVSTDRLASASA